MYVPGKQTREKTSTLDVPGGKMPLLFYTPPGTVVTEKANPQTAKHKMTGDRTGSHADIFVVAALPPDNSPHNTKMMTQTFQVRYKLLYKQKIVV